MLLYVLNGLIFATHDEAQNVPVSAYPSGTEIVAVPNGTPVSIGAAPPALSGAALAYAIQYYAGQLVAAQGLTSDIQTAGMAHIVSILTTTATSGTPASGQAAADLAIATGLYGWIKAVMAQAAALVAAGNTSYATDTWPAWDPTNAGWSSFIARAATGFTS